MADYYGVSVVPARVRSPKDKSSVEKAVLDLAEREILGKARHEKFFSIWELNEYIKKALKTFSNKKFQKKEGSRRSVFIEDDYPQLRPLPIVPYEFSTYKIATVHADYHISFDKHYYSVPYTYVRQKVELKIKKNTIEIYQNNERIAIHQRNYGKHNYYSTNSEHMPPTHQFYQGLSKQFFLNWADNIDPCVHKAVNSIFTNRTVEQQGYRACLGLQSLYKKNKDIFIQACELASEYKTKSYKDVNDIFKYFLEKQKELESKEPIIEHENIRGMGYYQTSLEVFNGGIINDRTNN